jgi:predicted DCC family thiol-disulfide oxidoreductase YuxK
MPLSSNDPLIPATPEAKCPLGDVVFFDGVCGLCNTSVDFIMRRDAARRFRFAPMQGETARRELPLADIERLDTLVLLTPSGTFRRSAAVVRILWKLPGIWPFLGCLLWLVPLPLRDFGYRIVSKNRLRWFGSKESCRVPTPEERDRFLM